MALLSDPTFPLYLNTHCATSLFVFHCSLYVTIMAKGMCVGDRVCAKKILGARRATAKLGKQVSKVELRGRVTDIVGAGPAASGKYGGTNL